MSSSALKSGEFCAFGILEGKKGYQCEGLCLSEWYYSKELSKYQRPHNTVEKEAFTTPMILNHLCRCLGEC